MTCLDNAHIALLVPGTTGAIWAVPSKWHAWYHISDMMVPKEWYYQKSRKQICSRPLSVNILIVLNSYIFHHPSHFHPRHIYHPWLRISPIAQEPLPYASPIRHLIPIFSLSWTKIKSLRFYLTLHFLIYHLIHLSCNQNHILITVRRVMYSHLRSWQQGVQHSLTPILWRSPHIIVHPLSRILRRLLKQLVIDFCQ